MKTTNIIWNIHIYMCVYKHNIMHLYIISYHNMREREWRSKVLYESAFSPGRVTAVAICDYQNIIISLKYQYLNKNLYIYLIKLHLQKFKTLVYEIIVCMKWSSTSLFCPVLNPPPHPLTPTPPSHIVLAII